MNSKLAGARVLSAVALVVMAAGLGATFLQCSPTPIILPAGTFNRPTDLAFACLSLVNESGPEGSGRTVTRAVGRPMALCHPTGHGDPAPDEDHRTFGFLTNSERGDLSVLDTYYCRSGDTNCVCASGGTSCFPKGGTNVDLDKAQPGDNGVPVGALPERVSASQDGCRVVTANRGSCDFAVVNTGVLLTEKLVADQSAERSTKRPDDVLSLPLSAATTRVSVRTASGRTLQVAPGEVAFLPQDTASVPEQTGFCDSGGEEGTPAPAHGDVSTPVASDANHRPWRAVATFPSCNLLALLEFPSGVILDSMKFKNDGGKLVAVPGQGGREPTCEVTDCDSALAGDAPDGGHQERVATTGLSALAVYPTGNRIFVGSRNDGAVLEVALNEAVRFGDVKRIALESLDKSVPSATFGVETLRLSLDPYAVRSGPSPVYGDFVHRVSKLPEGDVFRGPLEFAYAITTDGTVRVVDLGLGVECDTQIDADQAGLNTPALRSQACIPVAPGNKRLPGAFGPGLVFPAAPKDVSFALETNSDTKPLTATNALDGAFAFVLLSNGEIAIVNIDPTPRTLYQVVNAGTPELPNPKPLGVREPVPLTHSLRDSGVQTYLSTLASDVGPPRVPVLPANVDGYPRLLTFDAKQTLFNSMLVPTGTNFDTLPTAPQETGVTFPSPRTTIHQLWQISWEGDFFAPRFTGTLAPDSFAGQSTVALNDPGASFCLGGVYTGDIVTLTGCTADANCGSGQYCQIDKDAPTFAGRLAISGVCLSKLSTQTERTGCADLTRTLKRYEVVQATSGKLELRPHLDEKPVPTLAPPPGCNGSASSAADAGSCPPAMTSDAGAGSPDGGSASDGAVATGIKGPDGFELLQDQKTKFMRWLMPCTHPDSPDICRPGRICIELPLHDESFPGMSFCADAPSVEVKKKEKATDQKATVLDPAATSAHWQTCFAQLATYKISAGNSFLVAGSVSGAPANRGVDAKGDCAPDDNLNKANPLAVSRLWVGGPREAVCAKAPSRVAPSEEILCVQGNGELCPLEEFSLGKLGPAQPPCLFVSQEKDPVLDANRQAVKGAYQPPRFSAVSALFQNNQMRFILTDVDKTVDDKAVLQFEAQGGFSPQLIVPLGLDSEVDLPARILTSPIPSVPQISNEVLVDSDKPMLFVVDQRRSNRTSLGAVRGQVVRVRPTYGDTFVPVYEGFSLSGSYYPLQ